MINTESMKAVRITELPNGKGFEYHLTWKGGRKKGQFIRRAKKRFSFAHFYQQTVYRRAQEGSISSHFLFSTTGQAPTNLPKPDREFRIV